MFATTLLCLTMTIYAEARGEPVEGQIAVAAITINRTKDKGRPKSVCGVVSQKGQYTWNKKIKVKDKKAYKSSKKLASLYLRGKLRSKIGSRLYFNRYELGKKYKTKYKPIRIGKHIFY